MTEKGLDIQVVENQNITFNVTVVPLLNATAFDEEDKMSPALAVVLLYAILLVMVAAQTALFVWKKKHKRSYELVTLFGLWLMPFMFSVQLHFWRFVVLWSLYTLVTGFLIGQCSGKTLAPQTPRQVYTWFLAVYRVTKVVGIVGYALLLADVIGVGPGQLGLVPKDTSLDILWYGLYFGILGRDCAEVASERMAAVVGGGGRRLVRAVNSCGICNNELRDYSHMGEELHGAEAAVQLACKHVFHDLCIRGWTVVGKKDVCPVCCEKVDLRQLYAERPWETRNLTWIQMLDGVRYLVVWNPLIFMALSLILHLIYPHHHHHHPPSPMIEHSLSPVPLHLG